ncbi:6-phospho-beta-glucosidase [Gracilibacillus orientalis]|uniref:6-phospho-beta-glucosidase n=1 Tax=Gracilibacillus orientalis TaxID=334253 RepID=A0A1I4NGA1_9BACI|nr:6-phospho-beta-glucosidase [Gracilibacillus orientalis]SFM14406.1 6-phospho-beta-glucosidase [Gracilibacillus orientalis]
MSVKLVVIGGGSSYTPEIIEGVIRRFDSLPITEISLVDIEEGKDKLIVIANLAKRMIEKSGKTIQLSWTLDRRQALKNADFVSTQIRVGGLNAREKDERIPLKHGFIGQETNGAGGIMKAFRTIPILLELAEDVHEICPNAWIINFTNPAGIVTEALLKHSAHKKVIGVCNIPFNMIHSTAEILNADPSQVKIEFVGMNHFVFGQRVFVDGINRTDEVLTSLARENLDYSPANIVSLGWSKGFINSMKLLPNPYHQYYYQTTDILSKDKEALKEHGTRAEIVKNLEKSLFTIYSNKDLNVKPKELEERGGAFYSDVACSLIDSIYNNKEDIQTVNTFNDGAIAELPNDSVIEANCLITKNGPKPIAIGSLPAQVKGDILQMKSFEELVILASISGDYNQAYQAFIANPLIKDERKVKSLLDELLCAHKECLPQFNKGGKGNE